ncbi:hypothetical protein BBF96_12390 [Anoxybacter fermentans]|uniref:Aspartate aminotransferase family protein n=1 Tax=Anoxybacter fermentans TaxID=1323375 RepID=A0A3Q9HS26_9FIRM|nr:pyridoxal-dependent decarboxylase [Anoxybacter fermentans]AZR74126.1 hypothetical protein BBF96_12390 [Anoxybacter fermentans]
MDVYSLFPSAGGEAEKRKFFLEQIEKLLCNIDARKDPELAILDGPIERNYSKLIDESKVPEKGQDLETLHQYLDQFAAGNPYSTKYLMFNADCLPSIPSLLGMLTAALLNSNAIWDISSPAAAEAEVRTIAMMADIIGYNPRLASGYFTYGGQGGIFSGLRIGIEKAAPGSRVNGIPNNLYCFTSKLAHFSLYKAVETGIGTEKVISISTNKDNSMNLNELKERMCEVIENGGKIALVLATAGTTDAFGIDDVRGIKKIIDDLVQTYKLDYVPHLHADGAMGGLYIFFTKYDFDKNPLQFNFRTLQALRKITERISGIKEADSISIDFHKLGQTPYNNSLFMVKDSRDLNLVNLKLDLCPYIGEKGYGDYFTGYTFECSRMASAIAAFANLITFGIEGFQKILGNYVNLTVKLREQLKTKCPLIKIVNHKNYGPISLLRIYNNEVEAVNELKNRAKKEEIIKINKLNEEFYSLLRENRRRMMFGDTKKCALLTAHDTKEQIPINGTKAFIISPYTTIEDIDEITTYLKNTYQQLMATKNQKYITVDSVG